MALNSTHVLLIRYADRHLAILNVHYRVMRSMRGKPLSQYTEVSFKNDGGIHVVLVQDVQTIPVPVNDREISCRTHRADILLDILPALRAHAPHRVETHYGIVRDLTYDHRTLVHARGVSTLSLCHPPAMLMDSD
jgi:hypothetical protein